MLGPAWTQRRKKWDFDNPPKPLPPTDSKMKDAFQYCEKCHLTWLAGYSKSEPQEHPHHLAWRMTLKDIDLARRGLITEKSLIIHVHGEALPKGQASKSPTGNTAGLGVFLGAGSKYNMAAPYGDKNIQYDAEGAEIEERPMMITRLRSILLMMRHPPTGLTIFHSESSSSRTTRRSSTISASIESSGGRKTES
ncbi:hypothetical protein F4774DRAFT_386838 [Daldinia eschscholtzii]|nr:hypothetical protein F4774DRAFT_386838 [Daldinia eschscholtzii]